MPTDQALHDSIRLQLKRGAAREQRLRALHHRPPKSEHFRLPDSLPKLTPPKRVCAPIPAPGKGQDQMQSMRMNRRDWWRFKRAAYAQNKRAAELLRELMQQVVDAYECTLGERS